MYRIMIVDDEPNIVRALCRCLASPDHELLDFTNPEAAVNAAQAGDIDLVLSDYRMPHMDGVSMLKAIKRYQPDAMRLILSGYADLQGVLGAINEAEIYRFICKPWDDHDLKSAIQQALAHRALLLENRRLADLVRKQQESLDNLETKYPGITQVNWAEDGSIILEPDD